MISIIKYVEKILMEWMYVVQFRKLVENGLQFLRECILSEFNLPCIEITDTGDLEARSNDGWCLSLCPGEHNIEKVAYSWNRLDCLEALYSISDCSLQKIISITCRRHLCGQLVVLYTLLCLLTVRQDCAEDVKPAKTSLREMSCNSARHATINLAHS